MPEYQIGTFDPPFARRVADATRKVERMIDRIPTDQTYNLPAPIVFRNDSGHEIPPYGCCQVTDTAEVGNLNYLLAVRPISWTAAVVGPFFFNSPWAVPNGEYGNFQPGPVFRAISDGTFIPTGVRIGPIENSFAIGKGCLYTVIGGDDVATNCGRIVACETPLYGMTNSRIVARGSGVVTAKSPSTGDWVTGSTEYVARNATDSDVEANKFVLMLPIDAKWSIIQVC